MSIRQHWEIQKRPWDEECEMMLKHGCVWWWRFIGSEHWNKQCEGHFSFEFARYIQRSAFLHELSIRILPKYRPKKPWVKLPRSVKLALRKKWPMKHKPTIIGFFNPATVKFRPGWSTIDGLTDFNWPLAVNLAEFNDASILKELKRMIEEKRKVTGIQNPRRNKGRQHRNQGDYPFVVLEFMDKLKHLPPGTLTESEFSRISKARKKYRASI